MDFIWPVMLWLLLAVPILAVGYILFQRRRRRAGASLLGFNPGGPAHSPGARRHVPPAIFLAGFAILTVALARPQTVVSLPRVEGTVILAFDVSGSMAATDLTPTRMDAAKAAARAFVQRQPPTVQIGVVAFSDTGFSLQKPTTDQDLILAAINRLSPQRGTSLGRGIQSSLSAIASMNDQSQLPEQYSLRTPSPTPSPTPMPKGTYTSAVIVLLTDGENNESPDPLAAAQAAADRGVRIYTVGIGSAAGVSLHVNGFTVFTQLDEPTLKQIAQTTGGTYYNAQSTDQLRSIYDNLNPQLVIKPEKLEVTSIFAGASILVLLIGGVFSMVWFSRLP
jgi:Ca-activated chloride channel family protein